MEGEEDRRRKEILADERRCPPKVMHDARGTRLSCWQKIKGNSPTYDPKVDPSVLKEFAPVALR